MREKMDLCLVNMPYTPIERPSIALGLLQAILERDGLRAKTVYANLLFAREIGLHRHRLITSIRPQDPLGDWTFAHIAFPDFQTDHDAFIERLIQRNRIYHDCDARELRDIMLDVRETATRFIDHLAEHLLDKKPQIIGCSSTYMQHVSSLALLRRIRELAPEVISMMGGANCETIMGRSAHKLFPWVDYIVSGEADALIIPLVRTILKYGREIEANALPEGVFAPVHRSIGYPDNENNTAPRATTLSLNNQPMPKYDDYFQTLRDSPFHDKILVSLPIETSRGCWWGQKGGCLYCSLKGCAKGFRSKPSNQVVRELDKLHRRYNVNRFLATDNALEMDYFKTLFPRLAQGKKSYLLYYQIMSNLNRRQIAAIREAGMTWIWAGIESLNSKTLAHMNKRNKAYQNVQFLKWCRQYGIYVGWYIMCDFPREEDAWYQEMAEMMPLLTHLQPPWAFARVRFDRYSQYHERPWDYGLSLQPVELYSYVYPLNGEALEDLVYFFEDEARACSPLFESLLTRPGIRAASKVAARWKIAFWSGDRAVLTMSATDLAVHIRDTRPTTAASSFTLKGLDREIYLACDAAVRTKRLLDKFKKQGIPGDEVEGAVQGLLDRKLMIELDGHLLALAVREPMFELPERYEYPGGAVLYRSSTVGSMAIGLRKKH
jgi:ribosomal peptide maturation radical SAM protein 1